MQQGIPQVFKKSFLFLGLSALGLGLALGNSGCGQTRQAALVTYPATAVDLRYSLPHSQDWDAGHVEYFSRHQKAIPGTPYDCKTCHDQNTVRGKAPALKSTCAMSCHGPSAPSDVALAAPLAPRLPAPVKSNCLECHQQHPAQPNWHYPVAAGLCTSCHTVDGQKHAQSPKAVRPRLEISDRSCLKCHNSPTPDAHVHGVFAQESKSHAGADPSSCVQCHNPLGSQHPAALKADVATTCLECHGAKLYQNARVEHRTDREGRACLNCHAPHSSPNPKLLTHADPKAQCLNCHSQEIKGSGHVLRNIESRGQQANPHGSAETQNCTTCHTPHASANETLTVRPYPAGPHAMAQPDTYGLCLKCHGEILNPDLRSKQRPGQLVTEFRDDQVKTPLFGERKVERRNMHWFHVVDAAGGDNKGLSHSCTTCHDPHGAEGPHMIQRIWRMGQARVPLRYQTTASGGTCMVACHEGEARSYTRLK